MSSSASSSLSAAAMASRGRRPARIRCGECEFCLRDDCGSCTECVRKKKFGGSGNSKQACVMRRCINLQDRPLRHRSSGGGSGTMMSMTNYSGRVVTTTSSLALCRHIPESATPVAAARKPVIPVMACPQESSKKGGAATVAAAGNAIIPISATNESLHPHIARMYGMAIPILERKDVCAGCNGAKDEEAEGEPIILCDGKGCGCEFHLQCCIPPLREVPNGTFYCFDCSPEGTTSFLRQYFEEHDENRLVHPNMQSFLQALWQKDLADDDDEEGDDDGEEEEMVADDHRNKPDDNRKAKRSHKKKKKPRITRQIPESELLRATAMHALALSPLSKNPQQQQHVPPTSNVVVSPRDRYNRDDSDDRLLASIPLEARLLIGKPIKLYVPLGSTYHNGRIVSARIQTPWNPIDDAGEGGDGSSETEAVGMVAPSDKAAPEVPVIIEYRISFPAGIDGRKTAFHQWICLEEHSMAVATTLIWGEFDHKTAYRGFRPSRLWVRTTRELIPIRHSLKEEDGQVIYYTEEVVNKSSSKGSKRKTAPASPKKSSTRMNNSATISKTLCWGMAQAFGELGEQGFYVLRLQNSATDLFSQPITQLLLPHLQPSVCAGGSSSNMVADPAFRSSESSSQSTNITTINSAQRLRELEYAQARAEWEEQMRVYEWNLRRLENPAMPKAVSCLDEQQLGPLQLVLPDSTSSNDDRKKNTKKGVVIKADQYHAELAPSIPQGLDRHYLMKLLERRCQLATGSKDVAVSLSCQVVSSIPAALQAQRFQQQLETNRAEQMT